METRQENQVFQGREKTQISSIRNQFQAPTLAHIWNW